MKKIIVGLVLVFAVFSCKKETSEEKIVETPVVEKPADVKSEKISFTIEGMTCAVGCAGTIEKKIKEVTGVIAVGVDFENKKANVEYDSNLLSAEQIVGVVEGIGDGKLYKVLQLTTIDNDVMIGSGCCEGKCACKHDCKKDPALCAKDGKCSAKKCCDKAKKTCQKTCKDSLKVK